MVVMKGTNDDDVVACDGVTKAPFGVAGYEQSFLGAASSTSNRPANVDTAYAKDARVPVLWWWWFCCYDASRSWCWHCEG